MELTQREKEIISAGLFKHQQEIHYLYLKEDIPENKAEYKAIIDEIVALRRKVES